MARARNLKPSFFKNEQLVELDFWVRLLFAGLWTLADREGRLEDRPKKIKMELFPADDVDVNHGLQQLHDSGFILRYEAGGSKYIQIVKFLEHQNPHVKEAPSIIPTPDEHSANTISTGPITPSLNPDPESLDQLPTDVGSVRHGGPPDCPHEEILRLYHEILPTLPRVEVWNDTRRKLLRQRWRENPSLESWEGYFRHVAESRFLTGKAPPRNGSPPFVADLEWLIRPQNFAKVVEGKYHR